MSINKMIILIKMIIMIIILWLLWLLGLISLLFFLLKFIYLSYDFLNCFSNVYDYQYSYYD